MGSEMCIRDSDSTERQEGVEAGVSKLVGADPKIIVKEATRLLTDNVAYEAMREADNPFGDGQSAKRIVEILKRDLSA